jgi:hypothetical protein
MIKSNQYASLRKRRRDVAVYRSFLRSLPAAPQALRSELIDAYRWR